MSLTIYDAPTQGPSRLLILVIQTSIEGMSVGILDELATDHRAEHPGLFPQGENPLTIEAKAQGTRMNKKRDR